MEKEEGIKKFISGDFGKATIKGKITKEKIILELIMIGKPEEFIEYSGEELKCEFSINNIETFNCLLSNYLNRNMLCLAYYYNEKIRNKETYVFSLAGDRKLDLHFDKEFFSKLPSDLPILINRKVRNDALEFIKDLDIRNVVIQNDSTNEEVKIHFFPAHEEDEEKIVEYYCFWTKTGVYVAQIKEGQLEHLARGDDIMLFEIEGNLQRLSWEAFSSWLHEIRQRHASIWNRFTSGLL